MMENDEESRGFLYHVDYFLSNPNRWNVYFIALLIQCMVGIGLVIGVIVNALGRLTFNVVFWIFAYYLPAEINPELVSNNTCDKKEATYINIGSPVFALVVLALLRILAPIYVYFKNKYFFSR